jgi:hypothetical protein
VGTEGGRQELGGSGGGRDWASERERGILGEERLKE